MKTSDFDYKFPEEIIAQTPAEKRDHSKLMVLDRKNRTIDHKIFYEIIDYLIPGDVLVLNNTKVLPSNIVGHKEGGSAKVEVLLVKNLFGSTWECLVKPGKRLSIGSRALFDDGKVIGTVKNKLESGEQIIEFEGDLYGYMMRQGETPLPPYIRKSKVERRELKVGGAINKRYQTVYAEKEGASAAPTAGLHFTYELLKKIKEKGVEIAYITLHTGLGTFKPVYTENIEDHQIHTENFELSVEEIQKIKRAKRVVAVGTTTVRTLESIADRIDGISEDIKGETGIYIYPGYKFKIVDAMITNFHTPKSTLLMLVSAFAGKDFIMEAYTKAIEKGYRFFSFGDAMLIL